MDKMIQKKISFLPFLFLVPTTPLFDDVAHNDGAFTIIWSKGPLPLGFYAVYAPHFFFQWVLSESLRTPGQICSL